MNATTTIEVHQGQTQLSALAQSIRSSHAECESLAATAKDCGIRSVNAAIACGKDLIEAKKLVGHGAWAGWLETFCGDIHPNTARNYIRLANSQHVVDLGKCDSLRQAYLVAGIIAEKPKPAQLDDGKVSVNLAVIEAQVDFLVKMLSCLPLGDVRLAASKVIAKLDHWKREHENEHNL